MLARRKMRELAMQLLYLWDVNGGPDPSMTSQAVADATDDAYIRDGGLEMARSAWDQRAVADQWVTRLAPQWPLHRQPPVDRNLLRLAVWEMTNTPTPHKVVIDEAIELAKQFSTENSAAFVNGLLDAIIKEHRALTAGRPAGDPAAAPPPSVEPPAGPPAEPTPPSAAPEA